MNWGRLLLLASSLSFFAACATDDIDEHAYFDEVGFIQAGLSKCMGGTLPVHDFCNSGCQCLAGEGDCDTDSECTPGNVCGLNNGANYGFVFAVDVCWPPHCENGLLDGDETVVDCGGSCGAICMCNTGVNGDAEFCTPACKCSQGEGDCDTDIDCDQTMGTLTCGSNIGDRFGQLSTNDICVPPHCVNTVLDGDETGPDCGGSCGSCPATCSNGMMDGGETGLDCGGPCPACTSGAGGRANVDSMGNEANDRVFLGYGVSSDGRYIAFASRATNLATPATGGEAQCYLHDRTLGTTTLVSETAGGVRGDGDCSFPSVSNNGRYVAFLNASTNLVAGDTNGFSDVFVKDTTNGLMRRVNLGPGSVQADGGSTEPVISGNGILVAYQSSATNLVSGDTNGVDDVFFSRVPSVSTLRASVGAGGVEGDALSFNASTNTTGRYIAFSSSATNLVAGDTNGAPDVYVYDRSTATTTRVSNGDSGTEPNSSSIQPFVSGGGRYIVFRSFASNIVANDTNNTWDFFVYDRSSGITTRESVSTTEVESDASNVRASLSSNGNIVVFSSGATNLVSGDGNGTRDIFIRDRAKGTTTRVEGASGEPNGRSQGPVVSAGGGLVIYRSEATNLVAGDGNAVFDLFFATID